MAFHTSEYLFTFVFNEVGGGKKASKEELLAFGADVQPYFHVSLVADC